MIKLFKQIMKFGFVGFLCFFIDYGIMVFLTEVFDINYLMSSGISYSISTVVNYILSVTIVFETDKKKNRFKEFVVFVVLSLIGLGVNEVCMKIGVEWIGLHYMIVKIGATAVVMVYNFITRKIFIEKKAE
ncbi:MAG: GtrA family protein [Lachnospiraceae bacterium]|nr:GtrA family protein [Lachnospiraceae bacterium]